MNIYYDKDADPKFLQGKTIAIIGYGTSPESAISVTGRWAYSITPPDDIVRACRRLAAWYYIQRRNPDDLDRPLATADGMTIMPNRVPSDVWGALKSRRRITV